MTRRGRQHIACLCFVGSTTFVPSMAGAQDSSDLVKQGVQLRRDGRDAEALAVLERALTADPAPRTRAQVALAEQALGFWVAAERDLSAALAAGEGTWFVQHREALNAALDAIRRRLATLSVDVNVDGAELWVNGVRAGTSPMSDPIRVEAGTVVVEARAEGYSPRTRRLEIDPGTRTSDRVELTPVPFAPRVTSSGPSASVPIPWAGAPALHPKADARGAAAWLSFGAGVMLGVGGSVALLVRDDNATVYNDDSRCFHGNLTREQRCGSYRETAMAAQTLAIVQFAAAGLAIGTGTFLFLNEPKNLPPLHGAACSFGVGVACKFIF